jgi:hypothetical protein
MTYKPTWDVSQLPPHVSKMLGLAAVAAGALGCCGVLLCVVGAVGCELARDVAGAGFATVGRAAPDMTAIQKSAGRPR